MTRHTVFPSFAGCRLHGPDCHIMWGYDPAHTDSRHPYTLDELAERTEGPHRYAYPTADAYSEAWALWRALRRDSEPTYLERLVSVGSRLAPLAANPTFAVHDHAPHCPVVRELAGLTGTPEGFDTAVAQMCACTFPGWAAKSDLRVTEQSVNVHADPPPFWRPVRGPGRNGPNRDVANRTGPDHTAPAPDERV